jgi:hypothetical protein
MSKIYQRLLHNKFLILVLSLSLIAFLGLYLADTYFESTPKLSEILRSVAAALLTSFVVGFVFEYITRRELSDLISSSVHEQLKKFFSHAEGEEHLYSFWRSMLDAGLTIVVPEDESGIEPIVRVSDISASLSLYGGLIDKYGLPGRQENIGIEFISKNSPSPDIRSYKRNLVIVGAPGANPLASVALKYFYHLPARAKNVENGYVFAVDKSGSSKYLDSPFIIASGEEAPALLEIRNSKVKTRYDRIDPGHRDGTGRDACLLVSGRFVNAVGQTLNVLVIAGCSRFSTIDGIQFVMTNENWASLLPARNENVTATVVETLISFARGRMTQIARPPHSLL